jgi:hypothetical protein
VAGHSELVQLLLRTMHNGRREAQWHGVSRDALPMQKRGNRRYGLSIDSPRG